MVDDRSIAQDAALAALFVLAQGGDREAYNNALQAIYTLVESYVQRRVSSREDGEDLVQEIVLLVHKARHTYIPGRPIRPWIFSIARNRLYDYFRLRGLSRKNVESLLGPTEMMPDTPEDILQAQELQVRLSLALSKISENYGKAIDLMGVQGKSAREAAEELDISEGAARVWLHRAIRYLKEVMKED